MKLSAALVAGATFFANQVVEAANDTLTTNANSTTTDAMVSAPSTPPTPSFWDLYQMDFHTGSIAFLLVALAGLTAYTCKLSSKLNNVNRGVNERTGLLASAIVVDEDDELERGAGAGRGSASSSKRNSQ